MEKDLNEITNTALAASEKGEDLYGPFDNVSDLMEELNAQDRICQLTKNIGFGIQFQNRCFYIVQYYFQINYLLRLIPPSAVIMVDHEPRHPAVNADILARNKPCLF